LSHNLDGERVLVKRAAMALLLENIQFAAGETFRLLQWRRQSESLESLDPGGRRFPASGAGGRWHSHAELEFTIVTRGEGMRYVGDHVGPFHGMHCVLLGSHLPHCWMGCGPYDGYVLQIRLSPEHPFWRVDGSPMLRELVAAAERGLHFDASVACRALALLKRMADESALARAGLLLELLALLHGALAAHAAVLSRSRAGAETDAAARPRLETSVQWVLENLNDPLTLGDAVQRSAMSRATFCRQFLRYTGKTFVAFVNDARLAQAHQMLAQSARSITEIAYASGFGSLSHFNAAFRRRFGAAPRQERNSCRVAHDKRAGPGPAPAGVLVRRV
jgi:AraC-like DNA-binding protein